MVASVAPLADSLGSAQALVDSQGATSWLQLNERANRLVHVLRDDLGLGPGDAVLTVQRNRRELVELLVAARSTGLFVVPASPQLTEAELTHLWVDAGAKAFVGERCSPAVDAVIEHGGYLLVGATDAASPVDHHRDYEAALAAAPSAEPTDQRAGAVMPYTSGTTGAPKGVRKKGLVGAPANTMLADLQAMAQALGQPAGGTALVMAPMYHMGPLGFGILALARGATLLLAERFDAAAMLATIEAVGVSSLYAVPTYFARLLKLPEEIRAGADVSTLEYVFHTAAPCPPELKLAMIDWWGPVIVEAYGASEGGVVALVRSDDYRQRPGTVGRPLPTHEAHVVDPDGNDLPPGEVGTLYFRHRGGLDFEYHGDDAKTAEAHLGPGLFTFGDQGWMDEDGYLFLAGRTTELIITGGVNVYPAEIEHLLLGHPDVVDAAVVGAADADLGERVQAFVQPRPGIATDELVEELHAICAERLARFKQPRTFHVVEQLPRTDAGKLLKRLLRPATAQEHP